MLYMIVLNMNVTQTTVSKSVFHQGKKTEGLQMSLPQLCLDSASKMRLNWTHVQL